MYQNSTFKAIIVASSVLILTACGNNDDSDNSVGIPPDTYAPTLTLNDDFANITSSNVTSISVAGMAEDESGLNSVTYQLNDGETETIEIADDGSFMEQVDLKPGNNIVLITAIDKAGNVITTSKEIYMGETLAAGGSHTGALNGSKLYTWGRNNSGQTGLGYVSKLSDGAIHPNTPFLVEDAPDNIASISFNQNHSMALTTDGEVYTWGDHRFGQLGTGDNGLTDCIRTQDCRLNMSQVTSIDDAVMISAGFKHNLVLDEDGIVWAMGNNSKGQLGNGNVERQSTPVKVDFSQASDLGNIIQVVASANSSYALDDKGQIWGWGSNKYGNLGTGELCNRDNECVDETTLPVLISILAESGDTVEGDTVGKVIQLAAGRDHVLALTNKDHVYAWGLNRSSQVGYSNELVEGTDQEWADAIATPTKLPWFEDKAVREVLANGNTSYTILDDGTVYPWGSYGETNSEGKTEYLSLNEPTDKLPMLKDIEDMAVGALHQVARDKNGTLYSWGWSFEGSLGGGEPTTNIWMYNIPFPITLPDNDAVTTSSSL